MLSSRIPELVDVPPVRRDAPAEGFRRLIGASQPFLDVTQRARLFATTEAPVLVHGETGVGKELLARAIHESGARADGPFVVVNCGGLSGELLASELFGYGDGLLLPAATGATSGNSVLGKIDAARGGTLFLDDVGQMPLELQRFFLRVVEEGEVYPLGAASPHAVDFRLICGADSDLYRETRAGKFRSDLYYRIACATLAMPTLRERSEDLPLLVEAFAQAAAARLGIAPKRFSGEVLEAFGRYDWPGNVRELRNVVDSMVLLMQGEVVDLTVLPVDLKMAVERDGTDSLSFGDGDTSAGLERVERNAIGECLRAHAGNLTRTARELRIARSTLYAKLKKYGLEGNLDSLRFGGAPRRSSFESLQGGS
jgi:DNA-binding NtrC family response regulator